MKIGTSRSPKLLRLADRLSTSPRDALGLLNLLWEWVWEQTPRGDVGRWSDGEIATACGEPPERGPELVAALVESRWLDHDSTHRLVVHDYAEHVPEFLRKRLKRKGLDPLDGGDGEPRRRPAPSAAPEWSPDGGRTADRGGEGRQGDSGGSRAPAPVPPPAVRDVAEEPPESNPHPPAEPPPPESRSVIDSTAEALGRVIAILDEARGAPAENRPPRRVVARLTDRARRLGVGVLLATARAYAADQHVSTAGKSLAQLDAEWDRWSAAARKSGGPPGPERVRAAPSPRRLPRAKRCTPDSLVAIRGRVLEAMRSRVGGRSFEDWLEPLALAEATDERWTWVAPPGPAAEHVARNYRAELEEAATACGLTVGSVVVAEADERTEVGQPELAASGGRR